MAISLKEGRALSGEAIVERPDGTRRQVRTYPQPIRDASGSLAGAVNMVLDITDYKNTQEALRESEDRFRRYFELGLIGMATTSPNKSVLEVNDELCRILGYERAELLQKTWAELTHPDDLAADVVALCLYRVTQECLRNVARHANAASVRVTLRAGHNEIALEIVDNGYGFDPKKIKSKGRLGLISVDERCRLVNGKFSVHSEPGKGTRVNVRVALEES
jgi:PAS domain S-box-containing protein